MWLKWTNNPFGFQEFLYKECGGSGNCQFLSLAEALQPKYTLSAAELRTLAANGVLALSEDEVRPELEEIRRQVRNKEFDGLWDPSRIVDREALAAQIEMPNKTRNGYHFEGNQFTLCLLSNLLKVNIIVFNLTHKTVFLTSKEHPFTVFLLFYDQSHFKHFQALAQKVSDSHYQSVFFADTIPEEVSTFLARASTVLSPTLSVRLLVSKNFTGSAGGSSGSGSQPTRCTTAATMRAEDQEQDQKRQEQERQKDEGKEGKEKQLDGRGRMKGFYNEQEKERGETRMQAPQPEKGVLGGISTSTLLLSFCFLVEKCSSICV